MEFCFSLFVSQRLTKGLGVKLICFAIIRQKFMDKVKKVVVLVTDFDSKGFK